MIIEMAKQRHAQGATVRTLDRLYFAHSLRECVNSQRGFSLHTYASFPGLSSKIKRQMKLQL